MSLTLLFNTGSIVEPFIVPRRTRLLAQSFVSVNGTTPVESFQTSFGTPIGAGAVHFMVIGFPSNSASVERIVTDKGRVWTSFGTVNSYSRRFSVFFIPHSYDVPETLSKVYFRQKTAFSHGQFIMHGVDVSKLGSVSTPLGNNFFRTDPTDPAAVATTDTLAIPDGANDSFVLDFFLSSATSALVPSPDQLSVGETSTAPFISMSVKESHSGTNTMKQTAGTVGEVIHYGFVVLGTFRREDAYVDFLEDENIERTLLAEVGCAERAMDGWAAEAAVTPIARDYLLTTSTSFNVTPTTASTADSVGNGSPLMIVTVFSQTNSDNVTGVTFGGNPLRSMGAAIHVASNLNVSVWYQLGPLGSISTPMVVSVGIAPVRVEVRTFDHVNLYAPFELVNTFQNTSVSSLNQASGANKDDLILDALMIGTAASPVATIGATSRVQQASLNASGVGIGTSRWVSANGGELLAWTWGGATTPVAFLSVAIHPAMSSAVYSRTWTPIKTSGDDRSGIQRNFDHVEINGSRLLAQSPLLGQGVLASPIATNTSYFDISANKIYVRTVSGISPGSFASVTLEFFWLFANRLTDFVGGDYYEPRLTGVLPSIQGTVGDLLFDITSYPNGNIEIANADRFFDSLTTQMYWKNRQVRFSFGGPSLPRNQWRTVATMLIDDVQAGYQFLSLQLRAKGGTLQTQIPQTTIQTYFFGLSVDPEVASDFLPYTMGMVKNVELKFLTDTLTPLGPPYRYHYTIGDFNANNAVSYLQAIHRTTGVMTALGKFPVGSDWLSSTDIQVAAPYGDPETYILIGTITPSTPVYAGQAIRTLLLSGGVRLDELDAHSFALVDADEPIEVGFWQQEQVSVEEGVRLIEKSAFMSTYYTADGLWAVRQWVPSAENFDVIPVLGDEDLAELPQSEFRPVTPFFEFVVQYAYEPFYQRYEESSRVELSTIGLFKTQETFFRRTALVRQVDADMIAGRYYELQLSQPVTYRLTETGFKLLDLVNLDQFRLSLKRAISKSGSWDNEIVQVLAFEKTFNPESLTMLVDNMHGIAAAVKVAAPDGGDDWTTSSPEDRMRYAFAADDATERVDVNDPTTEGQAIAW